MVRELIFWGASGQAHVLRECIEGQGFQLIALFDNDPAVTSPFEDVPLFHGNKGLKDWLASRRGGESIGFVVAIGGARGRDRVAIHESLEAQGLVPVEARHRTSFVAGNVKSGAGCQFLAQSAVCVLARLGRCCIVNTSASIDHECSLGDGVHVCPGVHLAGLVRVGNYVTIGTGAVVLPRIKIGDDAMIGAGAVVTSDVPPATTVIGVPARPRR